MILTAFISVILSSVKKDAQKMENEVFPAYSAASSMQYDVAIEALFVMQYNYVFTEASWRRAQEFRPTNLKLLETIKQRAQLPSIKSNPQIGPLVDALEKNYQAFTDMAGHLPGIVANQNATQTLAAKNQAELVARVNRSTQQQFDIFTEEVKSGVSASDMQRRGQRIFQLATLSDTANKYQLSVLRGLYYRDTTHFTATLSLLEDMARSLEALAADSRRAEDQREMTAIKTLAMESATSVNDLVTIGAQNAEQMTQRAAVRDATLVSARELAEALNKMADEMTDSTYTSVNRVMAALIIGVLAALMFSVTLALLLTKSITRPATAVIINPAIK